MDYKSITHTIKRKDGSLSIYMGSENFIVPEPDAESFISKFRIWQTLNHEARHRFIDGLDNFDPFGYSLAKEMDMVRKNAKNKELRKIGSVDSKKGFLNNTLMDIATNLNNSVKLAITASKTIVDVVRSDWFDEYEGILQPEDLNDMIWFTQEVAKVVKICNDIDAKILARTTHVDK